MEKLTLKTIILTLIIAVFGNQATAQVALEGTTSDVKWFIDIVEKTRKISTEFDALWMEMEGFNKEAYPRLTIVLKNKTSQAPIVLVSEQKFSLHSLEYGYSGRKLPFISYQAWRDGKKIEPNGWAFTLSRKVLVIDRHDIEAFPSFVANSEKWDVSDARPNWAPTQESVLAHELAEYLHLLKNGGCYYSCKCPNGPEDDAHAVGKKMENHVRRAFGQTLFRDVSCGEKQVPMAKYGKNMVKLVYDKNYNIDELIFE